MIVHLSQHFKPQSMSFPQSLSGNPLWWDYRFPIKAFGNDKCTIIAENWYKSAKGKIGY
jgi:hypothetical protein